MKLSDTIELLPAEEYAKRFCVSRTTVFEWKKSGILSPGRHYIKIGRTLRFVWSSELIRELHDSNVEKMAETKIKTISPTVPQKKSNKKSAINMEY